KLTYLFPSLFLLGSLFLIILSIIISPLFILPLSFLSFILFIDALIKTKNLIIAFLAVFASFIQLYGYGYGFIKSAIRILLLKQEERKVFKDFFFNER
ncbi:MAG: glycosyl transferase family 2, partial [Saprospiraceae bacterium]